MAERYVEYNPGSAFYESKWSQLGTNKSIGFLVDVPSNSASSNKVSSSNNGAKNTSVVNSNNRGSGYTSPIIKFETLIGNNWTLCPPSTNLWTVEIKSSNSGDPKEKSSFKTLIENIMEANDNYNKTVGTRWGITYKNEKRLNEFRNSIQHADIGMFLCQSVSLPDLSVTSEQSYGQLDNHRGFILPGYVISNRPTGKQVQLSYLGTNYDLKDALFSPWCAAIAQQGLIEDESLKCLRADLFINLYSCGIPEKMNKETPSPTWQLRKQVKVIRAFPIGISEVNGAYDYETDNAGKFRVFNVDFNFDDIVVNYQY